MITKKFRTEKEDILIRDFLLSNSNFNSNVGPFKDELSYTINIHFFSRFMKYQFLEENEVLFRYGDLGNKYFTIIHGNVEICSPKFGKVQISKKEYVQYLTKMLLYNEQGLLSEILDKNRDFLPIESTDVDILLDEEMKKANIFTSNTFNVKYNSIDPGNAYNQKAISNNNNNSKGEIFEQFNEDWNNYIKKIFIGKNRLDFAKRKITGIYDSQAKRNSSNSLIPINKRNALFDAIDDNKVYNLIIATYESVNLLKTGDIFGERALRENMGVRSATVITRNECHFGFANNIDYDDFLTEEKTKVIAAEVLNLLKCPIFKNQNRLSFFKDIYFLLEKRFISRGEYIFRKGEVIKNIIILNEGEFVLKVKKNLFEINKLIKTLGGTVADEHKEFIDSECKYIFMILF